MNRLSICCAISLAVSCLAGPALAQTPQEVAAEREQWRQVCSDPNPDLAAGHLQQALESGDPAARRICLRATLESENEDLRTSALRQVIGSVALVRFDVTPPETGGNRYVTASVQNGLLFHASEGDPVAGSAMWSPLMGNVTVDERAIGPVNVFGTDIVWTGVALSANRVHKCNLKASLTQGSQVEGQLVCDGSPFAVTADLMD